MIINTLYNSLTTNELFFCPFFYKKKVDFYLVISDILRILAL